MATLDGIRMQIYRFYKSGSRIHITTQQASSKTESSDFFARITGVYPHLFIIEENSLGTPKTHTFQYTDIITGRVRVSGLNTEL